MKNRQSGAATSLLCFNQPNAILMLTICLVISAITMTPAKGAAQDHPMLPAPKFFEFGESTFSIPQQLEVRIEGQSHSRLSSALDRFQQNIEKKLGTQVRLSISDDASTPADLTITLSDALISEYPFLEMDESYELRVTQKAIEISASNGFGAMHALSTLLQLVQKSEGRGIVPVIYVDDAPRYPWRGLMIDVVRHWQPMNVLKRNIDALASAKMNVLHIHFSDDQAFRVESKKYPLLQKRASRGNYFTQDELRELVEYAADRGIRIVPEFDVPGHVTSILVAYPELGSLPGATYDLPNPGIGLFDNTLDPSKEGTFEFLENFFGEMFEIFPDQYFHVGGDEVFFAQWGQNDEIQEFMRQRGMKTKADAQAYFFKSCRRYSQSLRKNLGGLA